jgi:hypothetical protein
MIVMPNFAPSTAVVKTFEVQGHSHRMQLG